MNKKWKIFLSGVGSILAIYPSTEYPKTRLYDKHISSRESDADILLKDWERVGQDLISASKKISNG